MYSHQGYPARYRGGHTPSKFQPNEFHSYGTVHFDQNGAIIPPPFRNRFHHQRGAPRTDESAEDESETPQDTIGNATEVSRLTIQHDPPVENVDLQPYIMLADENKPGVHIPVDVNQDRIAYKWSKSAKRTCGFDGCSKSAKLQCLSCAKLGVAQKQAFYCSPKHLVEGWKEHRMCHQQAARSRKWKKVEWNYDEEQDPFHYGGVPGLSRPSEEEEGHAHENISRHFPTPIRNFWAEASRERIYVPRKGDVGRMLLLESAVMLQDQRRDTNNSPRCGPWTWKETSPVIDRPPFPKERAMVYASDPSQTRNAFRVMCYNVLAQQYATTQMYPYCPTWALSWAFRQQNIIREITRYSCDIICLQEVQTDHFDEFFRPEMQKLGFEGIFKAKTRQTSNAHLRRKIDGCAIFYKQDRFALLEQYGINFNDAADSSLRQSGSDYNDAKRRLMKGNIALVLVLEELGGGSGRMKPRRKRQLCVANTHVYWDPELPDVKLWQTLTLCKELGKLVLTRDLPLLLCGDFNSEPDSAVYELLSTSRVHPDHKVFPFDRYNTLPKTEDITHSLPLASCYRPWGEPAFTNYTGHFVGILDYMWYSKEHVSCVGVLQTDDEMEVKREGKAMPNPMYSSDHISLLAEFQFLD